MHSISNNEFWSALLEKAYAKLHGSYEALKGGTTCEAMVDFTGGCAEIYNLQNPPRGIFTIMYKGFQRCSLKGCSLEPDPNVLEARTDVGLVRGHAYSITKVVLANIVTPRAKGRIPLIRIRNPWGQTEWNGAWSDGSPEWDYIPMEEKQRLGIHFEHDGEFWMSLKDFMKHFNQFEICNLSPDSLESSNPFRWEITAYHGQWVRGYSAGGCRNYLNTFSSNPQYMVTLVDPDEDDEEDKCTMIVNLMQKGRRGMMEEGKELLTIGFVIYPVRGGVSQHLDTNFFKYKASCGRSKTFINMREVSVRFKLPPGTYVIIPSTFHPDHNGDFLLRIFTEAPKHSQLLEIY